MLDNFLLFDTQLRPQDILSSWVIAMRQCQIWRKVLLSIPSTNLTENLQGHPTVFYKEQELRIGRNKGRSIHENSLGTRERICGKSYFWGKI